MSKNNKFTIYYKPMKEESEFIKSFTLSFSRISEENNFYKKKAILEHRSKARNCVEEYKMKELHTDSRTILSKIDKIDFDKTYTKPISDAEYYFISYGDKTIETSNRSEIQYILDMFNFDKVSSITHKHYAYIKDMDEYTRLLDTLNSKLSSLNGEEIVRLSKTFKNANPYTIFQSMSWLAEYLDGLA